MRQRLRQWRDALSPGAAIAACLLDTPGGCIALLDRRGDVLQAGGSLLKPAPAAGFSLARLAAPAPTLIHAALAARQPLATTGLFDDVPVAMVLAPLQAGKVAAILRLTDRTTERDLEEALSQSQRLQEVGELAGGMAHDFNNLLTAILGAADDLAAHAAEADKPDLAQIRASASRGAELVRQLLAFSQRQTLQPRVLLLDDAVSNAASLLTRLLGSRITLVLALNAPGRLVHMDATQLDQVLMNLAVNARNAMPEGGTITITTDWRLVLQSDGGGTDAIPPGRYATIEMTDTGSGIPPDILTRIFDPFFTTRRGQGGTGLGLSMVQGIVRQSGGYLSVRSAPGAGTSFCITLPRHEPASEPGPIPAPRRVDAAAAAQDATAGAPIRRVLLVDDDDAVRNLAKRALVRAGWTVLEADSAESALESNPERIDCVVSDVAMPGMDGPGLIRALRHSSPRLPAVLISGYADAVQRRALAAEDIDFLPKPFPMSDLTRTVRAAVDRAPIPA